MRDAAVDATPGASTAGSTVAGGASRRGSGRRSGVAAGPALAPASSDVATTAVAGPASRTAASEEAVDDDGEEDQATDAGRRAAQPASERRRAGAVLVGLWREVTRDLLVVALGSEREVRDPALLDDLRATSDLLGTAGPDRNAASVTASHGDGASVAAGLTAFLARLDGAGELLAANVRAEIIVDTLVLGWPRARAATSPPATGPAAAHGRASA
jgi:hypothetical protein